MCLRNRAIQVEAAVRSRFPEANIKTEAWSSLCINDIQIYEMCAIFSNTKNLIIMNIFYQLCLHH